MLSKEHSPLYWMCVGGCLSFVGVLFFALTIITVLRASAPISEEVVKSKGLFILH